MCDGAPCRVPFHRGRFTDLAAYQDDHLSADVGEASDLRRVGLTAEEIANEGVNLPPEEQRTWIQRQQEQQRQYQKQRRVRQEMPPNTVALLSLIAAVLSLISSTVLGILALQRR